MWKKSNLLPVFSPLSALADHLLERKGACIVLVCFTVLLVGGCKRSTPADETAKPIGVPPAPRSLLPASLSRIHWLGKKRISADTNAVGLMKIWNLSESARLEAHALDKLALALANRLPITDQPSATTNYHSFVTGPSALLRPLLEDLIQEECYLEIRGSTNQSAELLLAIKLSDPRAALWQANLAAALESLTGVRAASSASGHRWQIQTTNRQSLIRVRLELGRARDWTLLAVGRDEKTPAGMPALLALSDLRAHIEHDHVPFSPLATKFWLDVQDLELWQFADAMGLNWKLPESLPKVSLTVGGGSENVVARGQLNFPNSLNLDLVPWNIPTNLISAPLLSFTAIRGLGPWLATFKVWNDLQIGPLPNQLYIWARQGLPMQTYFAAPQPDASNQVSKLTDLVMQKGAPFFATHDIVKFERAQGTNGLQWKGLPVLSPFLKSVGINGDSAIFGGLFVPEDTNNIPPPAELLQQLSGLPNMVFYDWELTGPRSDQWLYIGQFFRLALLREQMPIELPSRGWLQAAFPSLGNCGTVATITASNQLSFVRRSSVGFTAIELHLLADWLESPDFPRGLHSFLPAPPDEVPPAAPEKPEAKKPPGTSLK